MQAQTQIENTVTRRPPRILVVEDESIVARDLSDTLTELGYTVVGTVGNGEEAVAQTRELEPSLVIMDIALSGALDGVQASEQIHLHSAVPTIYLTVHRDDATLQRVAGTQPYGFIVKPFRADELRCTVEIALRASDLDARKREAQRWMAAALEEQALKVSTQLELQKLQSARQLETTHGEIARVSQSVAHGLRAPVRRIHGFCRALIEDHAEKLGADGIGDLQRVREASKGCARLIDGLDRLARVTQADFAPEPIDLSRLARSVSDELQASHADRHVEVTIQEQVWVQGDAKQLRMLLELLFENAWKFTAKNAAAKVEFSALDGSGMRVCSIRDNGVGFDVKDAQRPFGMFERFQSGDKFDGNGVGLAMAQRIVHRHGGQIWAESKPGMGASLYFIL
jgi:signal transduction histidine kinase